MDAKRLQFMLPHHREGQIAIADHRISVPSAACTANTSEPSTTTGLI